MEFKIKKITNFIVSFLEFEYRKQKIVKFAIAVLLSALFLDHTSLRDMMLQGALLGICTTHLKKGGGYIASKEYQDQLALAYDEEARGYDDTCPNESNEEEV